MSLSSGPALRSAGGQSATKSLPATSVTTETSRDAVLDIPGTSLGASLPLRGPPPHLISDLASQETHLTRSRAGKLNVLPQTAGKIRSHSAAFGTADCDDAAVKPKLKPSEDGQKRLENGVGPRAPPTRSSLRTSASNSTLGRLNGASPAPSTEGKQDEARTLRSKDVGPRFKSELSKFFPDYEDIMRDVSQSEDFFDVNEPILIVNTPLKPSKPSATPSDIQQPSSVRQSSPLLTPSRLQSTQAAPTPKRIDISALPKHTSDPLSDEYYHKAHRKKELAEKRVRSIEKETALHEKAQLEKLLLELQSPDWLKALGASALPDGERKQFEPKRAYFIRESRILLEKFRRWKEEEKRLKLEKEKALAAEQDGEDSDEQNTADDETTDSSAGDADSSDVDASAARQLLNEANQAYGKHRRKKPYSKKNVRLRINPPKEPPDKRESSEEYGPPEEDHIFGMSIPRYRTCEFSLPESWITEEALRTNARKRRKLNRDLQQAKREEEQKKARLA